MFPTTQPIDNQPPLASREQHLALIRRRRYMHQRMRLYLPDYRKPRPLIRPLPPLNANTGQ